MSESDRQENSEMGKYKEHAMYNILSLRVTDEEKAMIDKLTHQTRKNISMIMREAMNLYSNYDEVTPGKG